MYIQGIPFFWFNNKEIKKVEKRSKTVATKSQLNLGLTNFTKYLTKLK